VAEVIKIVTHRGDFANTPVWFLSIVPDEIIHQLAVKIVRLVQIVEVEIDTLLLDGAVKSLQETV
jgi:hypothetical protein